MDYATRLGAEPGEVVRPTTVDEVAAVIARANSSGRVVIPWGGGLGQGYGYLPDLPSRVHPRDSAPMVLLDLTSLNQVLAHEPGDMTVTVQAGITLDVLQRTLSARGQWLPLDPPHPDRATIGGILATNAHGPSRLTYGTARDWLIGLKVVDAQGRLIKGGGTVVKNVTGYDLPKLHVGALGTLGVIVEATFKLAPLPESRAILRYDLPPGSVDSIFLADLHEATLPTWSTLSEETTQSVRPAYRRRLHLAFEGQSEVVESAVAKANRLAADVGLSEATVLPAETQEPIEQPSPSRLRVRLIGRPDSAGAQHEAVGGMAAWEWVRTLPGVGQTEAALRMGEDAEYVAGLVLEWARGRQVPVSLLHAPASLRRDGELWWPLPSAMPLMRRLKTALDPLGTLNAGRFVGGL